jgi:Zn-dependent protease with chaperone function
MKIRALASALALAAALGGCTTVPPGAYYPLPADPSTALVARILHRAALAAGDDPARYSFAFVKSPVPMVLSDEEASLYVTEGLARLPVPVIEALMAHEVAHEVLGHVGTRRALALSMTVGFTALGALFPGAGLADLIVSPVAVRAFTRRQVLEADRKAVEILRAMGHAAPRRALATALKTAATTGPRPRDGLGGLLRALPPLEERLAALEPLEPVPVAAGS